MELIYASMLLHKAGQPINEDNLKKVVHAAGAGVSDASIKAVVSALDGVNIDQVLKDAANRAVAAPAAVATEKPKEEKKEEKKDEAQAAAGLGALFG